MHQFHITQFSSRSSYVTESIRVALLREYLDVFLSWLPTVHERVSRGEAAATLLGLDAQKVVGTPFFFCSVKFESCSGSGSTVHDRGSTQHTKRTWHALCRPLHLHPRLRHLGGILLGTSNLSEQRLTGGHDQGPVSHADRWPPSRVCCSCGETKRTSPPHRRNRQGRQTLRFLTLSAGTGKTFIIQKLADAVGSKLVVLNMSQQSDSTDLLG